LDIETNKIPEIPHVSQPCINRIFKTARQRIAEFCEADTPFNRGKIEINETFFDTRIVQI